MYKRVLQPIVFVLLMAVVYGCNQKAQTPLPSPSQNDSTSVAVNEQEDGQRRKPLHASVGARSGRRTARVYV